MKVNQISERALIDCITKLLTYQDNIIAAAGEDDCAVLDIDGESYLLITTDMLHRKTDFPFQMTGWQIGWMAAAVNLSDIAAKGAHPIGLVMAMGIPPDSELGFVEDIVRGMQECALRCKTQIVGGDTESHDELTIVGTALGVVKKELLVRRSGAKTGDLVCVTGHLGTAGTALIAINNNIPVNPSILKTLFEPIPKINEGIALANSRVITSMMDISDGLALSLHDMSAASNVGFRIYQHSLPVLPEVKRLLKDKTPEMAVYAGGDFELLFTVAPENLDKARKACALSVIGEVIEEGVFIEREKGREELEARGYQHFGNNVEEWSSSFL